MVLFHNQNQTTESCVIDPPPHYHRSTLILRWFPNEALRATLPKVFFLQHGFRLGVRTWSDGVRTRVKTVGSQNLSERSERGHNLLE